MFLKLRSVLDGQAATLRVSVALTQRYSSLRKSLQVAVEYNSMSETLKRQTLQHREVLRRFHLSEKVRCFTAILLKEEHSVPEDIALIALSHRH
jgi:hypothetical protein